MNKIIIIAFFSLLLQTAHSQDRLYKTLSEYIPYMPFEKKTDSVFAYYTSNKNFTADSLTSTYLKGTFKNFNPAGLRPSKIVIEIDQDKDKSVFYAIRICLDSAVVSKEKVRSAIEKIHDNIKSFFAKDIMEESGKKDKYPYRTYNYYSPGQTFPAVFIGWGYNQSPTFTGYYLEINLPLNVQQ